MTYVLQAILPAFLLPITGGWSYQLIRVIGEDASLIREWFVALSSVLAIIAIGLTGLLVLLLTWPFRGEKENLVDEDDPYGMQ